MDICKSLGSDKIDTEKEQVPFLVIETHGELYAVRWALIREARILFKEEINFSAVPPEVRRDNLSFPLCYLWESVGLNPPKEGSGEIPAVFLEETGRRMALIPERILWKQEAKLRDLPCWVRKAPSVAGAIVLDSGVIVIVIEPLEHSCGSRSEEQLYNNG